MFEFRWQVPGEPKREAILRLHSRSGWVGRKTLTFDARTIFRRSWFEGIETRFPHRESSAQLHLRMVPIPGSPTWRPALFRNDEELPELTGTAPPHLVRRPKSIAVVTGLTYLTMLMAIVMLLSIVKMLDAIYLPRDDRKLVLIVNDPAVGAEELGTIPQRLPGADQGQLYTASLAVHGGAPPYTWRPVERGWPKDMTLDFKTGAVTFTPRNRYDCSGAFEVTDAKGHSAPGAFTVVVRPGRSHDADWPRIDTQYLPPAVAGAPYEADIRVTGGRQPLTYSVLTGNLPNGLKLDSNTGKITGTPGENARFRMKAGLAGLLADGPAPDGLRDRFDKQGIPLSEEAAIQTDPAGNSWRISDAGRRFTIRQDKGGLHVFERAGHHQVTIRAADNHSYRVWQEDIWPWVVPFLVTAIALLAYWNMRRWGVYFYAPAIVVQGLLAGAGLLAVPVTALVLQVVLWCLGAAHLGKMH